MTGRKQQGNRFCVTCVRAQRPSSGVAAKASATVRLVSSPKIRLGWTIGFSRWPRPSHARQKFPSSTVVTEAVSARDARTRK